MTNQKASPRSHLKQITSEARKWPGYMRTASSASRTSPAAGRSSSGKSSGSQRIS